MPDFYQSCVTSWAFFKAKLKNNDKEHILNENLFGNNNISVRNTSIFYSDFSRCNIKTVRDIRDLQNGTFHTEQYIQNTTAATQNWRQKFNKLKANIPNDWINILKSNDTQTQIKSRLQINSELNLYIHDKIIEPNKLPLKVINNQLMDETHKLNANQNGKQYLIKLLTGNQFGSRFLKLYAALRKNNFNGKLSITQFSPNINCN